MHIRYNKIAWLFQCFSFCADKIAYHMLMRYFIIMILGSVLVSCSHQASHVPNPILLPAYGVQSIFGNGIYNNKRKKVAEYVRDNFSALSQDILDGNMQSFNMLYKIADIPTAKQTPLYDEIKQRFNFYFDNKESRDILIERLTVTVMVHSN